MSKATPILPHQQGFLDEHFQVDPNWKKFHRNLRSKSFVATVRQDTRSDSKLKRFVRMVGLRQQSKSKGIPAPGDGGKTYKIKYHPEARRFSCSCRDWTYKRSVKNRGPEGDCKHIKRMKEGAKQTLMSKVAALQVGRALRGRAALALLRP